MFNTSKSIPGIYGLFYWVILTDKLKKTMPSAWFYKRNQEGLLY